MTETSWTLRLALLAIGVIALVAVYLFSHRRRNTRYARFTRRPSFNQEPLDDIDHDPVDDEIIAVRIRKVEPEADLPVVKNENAVVSAPLVPSEVPVDPDPERPTRGRKRKAKADQMSLGLDGEAATGVRGIAPEPVIIALYLRAHGEGVLHGPDIVRAAHSVGLRYGELQIFHHYGTEDLVTERPLFSLADMFEPGFFDLDKMASFQTPGLAMFLNLPTGLDGAVAFELFLNTAQRLAEALRANLFGDRKIPLNSVAIEQMRRTAARY